MSVQAICFLKLLNYLRKLEIILEFLVSKIEILCSNFSYFKVTFYIQ